MALIWKHLESRSKHFMTHSRKIDTVSNKQTHSKQRDWGEESGRPSSKSELREKSVNITNGAATEERMRKKNHFFEIQRKIG